MSKCFRNIFTCLPVRIRILLMSSLYLEGQNATYFICQNHLLGKSFSWFPRCYATRFHQWGLTNDKPTLYTSIKGWQLHDLVFDAFITFIIWLNGCSELKLVLKLYSFFQYQPLRVVLSKKTVRNTYNSLIHGITKRESHFAYWGWIIILYR